MTWNYRLILHDTNVDAEAHWIGLHEVYYDGERIKSWTENAVPFECYADEGAAGLINSLQMALRDAQKHPMLLESELCQGKRDA
jgi:hypothetical protein